jgi:hypothetical protein
MRLICSFQMQCLSAANVVRLVMMSDCAWITGNPDVIERVKFPSSGLHRKCGRTDLSAARHPVKVAVSSWAWRRTAPQ